jgi:hypothetical protein
MNNMQTLEGRFIYYTETQLATLEMMKSRKRTSKADLNRQGRICDGMMDVVNTFAVRVDIVGCPRVLERVRQWAESLNDASAINTLTPVHK